MVCDVFMVICDAFSVGSFVFIIAVVFIVIVVVIVVVVFETRRFFQALKTVAGFRNIRVLAVFLLGRA